MASELRAIVAALNEAPFNRKLNLISFDSLSPNRLLQELSDVLCSIEGIHPSIDIREEPAEETAIRLLNSLKILKYKPPTDPDQLQEWREGLVTGEKTAIYPVLNWILSSADQLRERAYLARFLVHVQIPSEMQTDAELNEMIEQCSQLMDNFKDVHSRVTELRGDSAISEDIRGDLRSMGQEKEQLMRRIERVERKVKNVANRDKYLAVASQFRDQQQRQEALQLQRQEQRNALLHAEQRLQRLSIALRDIQNAADTIDPMDLIQQLQERISTNSYLANEKLRKEIDSKRAMVGELTKIAEIPAIDQSDIDQIKKQIEMTNAEILDLIGQRDQSDEQSDDKLSIYRHQAANVARKKASLAEKLQESRMELDRLEAMVEQRRAELREKQGGGEVITSVHFKNYLSKLRSKTTIYKKKRAEMEDIRSELGVLARTEEILTSQWNKLKLDIEAQGGHPIEQLDEKPVRPKTAKPTTRDTDQLKDMLKTLSAQLDQKKNKLNELMTELKTIKAQHTESSTEFATKKRTYDAKAAALESNLSRLETEVNQLRHLDETARWQTFRLETQIAVAESIAQRLNEPGEFISALQKRVEEATQESEQWSREQARAVNEDGVEAAVQVELWKALHAIFEAKLRVAHVQPIVIRPSVFAVLPVPDSTLTTPKMPIRDIHLTAPIPHRAPTSPPRTKALEAIRPTTVTPKTKPTPNPGLEQERPMSRSASASRLARAIGLQ